MPSSAVPSDGPSEGPSDHLEKERRPEGAPPEIKRLAAHPRDAAIAKALTLDEARRIAANIAKLPDMLGKGKSV